MQRTQRFLGFLGRRSRMDGARRASFSSLVAPLVASCVASFVACHGGGDSHEGGAQPSATLDIAFPAGPAGGAVAHAAIDPRTGSLVVTAPWASGALVSSVASRALLAVKVDVDDPDAWHDPEATTDDAFVDVASLQQIEGAPAGSVHLRGAIPNGGTADVVFAPSADGEPGALRVDVTTTGAPVALIELRFAADPKPSAYVGFGERFTHVDATGSIVPLSFRLGSHSSGTNEAHVPIPAFTSTRGYGVTVATGEAGAADVGREDPAVVRLVFEGGALHARIVARPSPIDVVAALTATSGLPRLPPRWAFAPFQWRNQTIGTSEVLSDLKRTRAEKIPGGCLWIDNPWQVSYDDGVFDPTKFPDPKAMIAQANALGFEMMVWSTPYLEFSKDGAKGDTAQAWFDEAKAKGFLVTDAKGKLFDSPEDVAKPTSVAMIDLVSPAGNAWWTDKLRPLTALGVRGYKLDFGEDLLPEFLGTRLSLVLDGKPSREQRSKYPLAYHRAYRASVSSDAFILGRASSLGGQSEVDAIWPGDLDIDFRPASDTQVGGLPASVVAIQTLSASGFPTYASDTGGFRGGRAVREVWLRWAEHNAYSMSFQNGGGGESHNPWAYDDAAIPLFRELARRHMDLVPYRRALAARASLDGTPTVRALPLQYPAETQAIGAHADDEYLLGPDLLIAPVLTAGATSREVYVPSGAWVRWTSGARVVGPIATTLPAVLGDPIVLVREGAVLPLLASDVDTLGSATDVGVVTAAMRATVYRAYAAPPSKNGEITRGSFENGSAVDVSVDAAGAVSIAFAPKGGTGTLSITLDLAARGAALSSWTFEGVAMTSVASVSAVASCTSACFGVDADKKRVVLFLPKGGAGLGT